MKFRKGYELACDDYVNLKWESERVEKVYETLVEELKEKLCKEIYMNEEDKHAEVEDTWKYVDRDFFGCKRRRFFESDEELESDESENEIEDIESEEQFERKRKKAKKKPNMKWKKRCADCMTDHDEFLGHWNVK